MCAIRIDGGCGCDPDLFAFFQRHCHGGTALLEGFLAVKGMVIAAIFFQVRISPVVTVEGKAPREDIHTPYRSSEAVVASVETIA